MFFRSAYNYDTKSLSDACCVPVSEIGDSLTVQSMAEEADLNVLLKRFGVTGHMPVNPKVPTYGDYSQVTDFASAMSAILEAQDAFDSWPADVRARFGNNPQRMLEFCTALTPDNKLANIEEMRKMGFANPEKVVRRETVSNNVSAGVQGNPAPVNGGVESGKSG